MKKKILLTLLLTLAFALMLVIGISAAGQSYTTFDVTLTDGTQKTAYSAGVDQWEGRVYLNAKLFAEAPIDTEGTYQEIDWTTVKEIDFSNAMLYLYDSNKNVHTEKAYGSNQSGTALCICPNGVNKETQLVNLEKVTTGKAVTLRESAFNGCANLKTLVISSNLKYIQNNVFYYCTSLEEIIFDGTSQLETVSDSFLGCTSLKEITIPASMKKLSGKSFWDCTSLEKVVFEEGCKAEIGNNTFYGCTSLTSVTLSEGITKLGSGAFQNCTSLAQIGFPSTLTELGSGAFNGCTSLTSIYIPATITKIGSDCWRGCSGVTKITMDPNCPVTHIYAHTFDGTKATEITLSNSVQQIGQSNFNSGTYVTINLGASFVGFNASNAGQPPFALGSSLKYMYLSDTFTAESVRNCVFSWNDNKDNEINKNYINLTFFYTGTKEQAQAIINKAATGGTDGAVLNTYIATMTLISAEDYAKAVENGTLVEGVSGAPARYMVYGYNKCEAFYGGEHTISDNAVEKFEGEAYTSRYISVCACTRGCGSDAITEICGPLFYNKGYSKAEIGGEGYIDFGIALYKENIEAYVASTGEQISYGFIVGDASKDTLGGKLFDENGAPTLVGAITTDFSSLDFNVFSVYNLKLTGIKTELQRDKDIYVCAYVLDGGVASYIGDTVTTTAVAVDYVNLPVNEDEQ